ncbi:pyridoxamine 5'-phosphate oxidase family protein [Aequorivita marina]|uniref:pyridoxamine 5'-phosphate oxidase family protein n=1 Tax=Aequorivita marina TaxID=3073654 RepID=UPI00287483A1|nr:pyridoxamine 5'-phosphate oxidase family protein [Aequorivita sp. S2608]MDS1297155.1 pyridoxamine 5'-phosphate oxidase family protein [Aequorivita sp. S2608]
MSKENLSEVEAKQKFREMVDSIKIAMFATNLSKKPLSVAPMYTKRVDEAGNLWFLSSANSNHNEDILRDADCQLLYSDGSSDFLSVYGVSEIINDRDTIDSLYNKTDNAYFNGADDPQIRAIKFIPEEAAYWSADGGKLVSLFKMGVAAVTGKDQDVGTSGKMDL